MYVYVYVCMYKGALLFPQTKQRETLRTESKTKLSVFRGARFLVLRDISGGRTEISRTAAPFRVHSLLNYIFYRKMTITSARIL